MNRLGLKEKKRILGVAILAAIGLAWLRGCVGQPAWRIEREHGLKLPVSASHFECRGDAWLRDVIDCGAASTFEMSKQDLPDLVSQLQIHKTHPAEPASSCPFPSNDQYQVVHRPWMSGTPLADYSCASRTGDELFVRVFAIDDARVGVCLYTDWN